MPDAALVADADPGLAGVRITYAPQGMGLDPIVSVLWGILVFDERVRGGRFIALAVISGLVMASAVVALARSPLLSGPSGEH